MATTDPLIVVNDILEVTYKGTLCSQTVLTVMHYRAKTLAEAHLTDALDDMHESLIAAGKQRAKYLAAASGNYVMQQIVLQVIKNVRYARYPYDENQPGLIAAAASTADLAAYCEFSSPFTTQRKLKLGRGLQGGMHFGPVPANKIALGLIDAAYIDNELSELAAELTDEVETDLGNHWQPVIYHPKDATVPYTDITRFNWKPEARVMRRRTVGRGI